MSHYLKGRGATVDYSVDWGAGYLDGPTVTASAWSVEPVEPGGVAVVAEVTGATRTAATLEGGLRGRVYRVMNMVTFSDGRDDARTLVLRVEDR
jgi:hypothetical protein